MSQDPQIANLIEKEVQRQREGLEMIPSENHTSDAVLEALGSRLTDKYSEGYPGIRYYGGCDNVDAVENLARRSFSVPIMQTSNHTPAARQILLSTLPFSTPATPSWA